VVWAPTFFLLRDVDTWQLIINTVTTIITLLMVALLQNSQTRTDQAVQHKLNAIADGLADPDLMAHIDSGGHGRDLQQDFIELRSAVGSNRMGAPPATVPTMRRRARCSGGLR
jgi:Low affinity iron permease